MPLLPIQILSTEIDQDSPVNVELMGKMTDRTKMLENHAGRDYLYVPNHNHDGVNSAPVALANQWLFDSGTVEIDPASSQTVSITLPDVAVKPNQRLVIFSHAGISGPFQVTRSLTYDGIEYPRLTPTIIEVEANTQADVTLEASVSTPSAPGGSTEFTWTFQLFTILIGITDVASQ